jgi:hypothetical protein
MTEQPADQTALRDRIAAAIWERQNPGRRWADCEYRWRADAEADADAVLAVLPAPADRAAVLREAAEVAARFNSDCQNCAVELEVATKLRRMADEAQQPETQARLAAYQTCGVCSSGYPTGGSCGGCAFNARMAAEARPVFELPGPDVVAYRNSQRPGVLLCREHGDGWWGLTPLTSDDLPDGGTCTYGDPADPDDVCGRDVLIAEARQADTAGEQQ